MPDQPRISLPGNLTLEMLQRAARLVGAEFGCRLIVLFGSAARSSGATAEDVDIGVLGPPSLDTVAVTNRFIRALEAQSVDVADLGRADPLLLSLVARDGYPLYEAPPGEFACFASLAVRRYADTRKFRDQERQEISDRVGGGIDGA